jgi:hypothetical protein
MVENRRRRSKPAANLVQARVVAIGRLVLLATTHGIAASPLIFLRILLSEAGRSLVRVIGLSAVDAGA